MRRTRHVFWTTRRIRTKYFGWQAEDMMDGWMDGWMDGLFCWVVMADDDDDAAVVVSCQKA